MFLKINWYLLVFEFLIEEFVLVILCFLFIDILKLGINSSCFFIECGNDFKLYGDFDCNVYFKIRCINNSIGNLKIIYLVYCIVLNYLKYVNSF